MTGCEIEYSHKSQGKLDVNGLLFSSLELCLLSVFLGELLWGFYLAGERLDTLH